MTGIFLFVSAKSKKNALGHFFGSVGPTCSRLDKTRQTLGHSVFSTLQNQFKLVHGAEQNAHSTLQLISSPDQISQEGNKCTTTKEKVRAYCPNICTVKLELRQ